MSSSSSFLNCLKVKRYVDSYQFSYYRCHDVSNSSCSPDDKTDSFRLSESKRCSLSRSISTIKDIVKCNYFDYFFTLTLKDNIRYDIPSAIAYINRSIKAYKRKSLSRNILFSYDDYAKGSLTRKIL